MYVGQEHFLEEDVYYEDKHLSALTSPHFEPYWDFNRMGEEVSSFSAFVVQ